MLQLIGLVIIVGVLVALNEDWDDDRTYHVFDRTLDDRYDAKWERHINRMIHTTSGDERLKWLDSKDLYWKTDELYSKTEI